MCNTPARFWRGGMSARATQPVQARGNTRGNHLLEPGGVALSAEAAPVFIIYYCFI